eukprot:superscaffoldBa00000619_g6098
MDQPQHELEQIATWFNEEGLASDAPKEAQLCLLWRTHQHTRSQLSSVIRDMDTQRSQHLAEMAEVRRSLEQIRIFTEHKNVLAQEIQDENDQLKDQLHRLISLQDAQISEVAKMLYQQGLTELIHSSPSEQVAYLLVERASLLETREEPDNLTRDGQTASPQGPDAQGPNINVHQAEARHLAVQASSVEKECSRLERDLEEGSRRLAMAHNEIRRLTDELESAHLTQKAYEPELQGAQQEVEQLRQEVEKLKKYEMVELRKAKELNDRLDLEIRALRNRVRSLDAEKNSLQQTVASLQEEVDSLESALQEQQQLLTVQGQSDQTSELNKSQAAELAQSNQTCRKLKEKLTAQTRCLLEKEETVVFLQKEVDRLESALQEQQQQLLAVQVQAEQANELAKIHSLKQQLDNSHKDFDDLIATICTKENNFQDQNVMMPEPSEILGLLDNCQSTSSPHHFISAALSRSAEMGYLNLTSGQSRSDYSTALGALSTSESEELFGREANFHQSCRKSFNLKYANRLRDTTRATNHVTDTEENHEAAAHLREFNAVLDFIRDLGIQHNKTWRSVSAFKGKGKVGPLKKLQSNPKYHAAFRKLGDDWSVEPEVRDDIEAFMCLMYGQTQVKSVDAVCSIMLKKAVGEDERLTTKSKVDLSRLPPETETTHPNHHLAIYKRADKSVFWCPKPYDPGQGLKKTD